MLTIKQGDLFEAATKERCIIAHGCNAQGVMGSGFALLIRKKYPRAWASYQLRGVNLKVGQIVPSFGKEHHNIVINCITQEFFGRDTSRVYVDYEAVKKCMWHVADIAKDYQLPVHIPLIGGGLANGNRNMLVKIFEDAFLSTNATLWLYGEQQ